MSKAPSVSRDPAATRGRLVDAAVRLMLHKGFAATSVDEICGEAGMTKGAFFYHFENKEAVGRAAVEGWGAMGEALYAEAWKDGGEDPLRQLDRMFDIMSGFAEDSDEPCVCMVGMMSQELSLTHPAMRGACAEQLEVWTRNVAAMLAAAKKKHRPSEDFDPEQAAWFINSLWQGSMLVAKACNDPGIIVRNIGLVRAFIGRLFSAAATSSPRKTPKPRTRRRTRQ